MEQYKKEFIEFMVDCNVLKFGDFVTKSGRKTPFFVNTGFYRTGAQLVKLGEYYARAIKDKYGLDFVRLTREFPCQLQQQWELAVFSAQTSSIVQTVRR